MKLGTETIERKTCTKFLGIYIDEKLSWQEHISYCKAKLSNALYAINRIRSFVPIKVLKSVYFALVYPHLMYGITLWGSTYKLHLDKIKIMQKRIVRSIYGAEYNAHTHTLFTELIKIRRHLQI